MRRALEILGVGALLVAFLPAADAQTTVLEQSYDVSAGRLVVAVSDADVEVTGGESETVVIKVVMSAKNVEKATQQFEQMNFRTSEDDGVVRIESDPVSNWSLFQGGGFSLEVHVTVPTRFDISVATSDGDVSVQSVEGEVVVASDDGDIRLDGIAGPKLVVTTSDGDILIGTVTSTEASITTDDGDVAIGSVEGQLSLRTTDGDIQIDDAAGTLDAWTDDGDIEVRLSRLVEASLSSGDGDILIRAGKELAAELDLRGDEVKLSGEIRFEGHRAEREVRGALNGGGPILRASAADGTVKLVVG